MIDLLTLVKVISKVALSHDNSVDPHKRINTVSVLSFITDLNSEYLGRSYEDVEKGWMWRRKGMSELDMNVEHGLFGVLPIAYDGIDGNRIGGMRVLVDLIVAFPVRYEGSPDEYKEMGYEKDQYIIQLLMSYWERILEYEYLKINDGGEEKWVFEHPDLKGGLTVLEERGNLGELRWVDYAGDGVELFSFGNEDLRMARQRIEVNVCVSRDVVFDTAQGGGEADEIYLMACPGC